jgi:hypothetical protein
MRQDGGARIRRTGGRRDERVSIHKGSIRRVGSNILHKTGTTKIVKLNTSQRRILVAKTKDKSLIRVRNSVPDCLRIRGKASGSPEHAAD